MYYWSWEHSYKYTYDLFKKLFFLGTDDGHRVVLKPFSDGVDCEHDYINATYIDVRSFKSFVSNYNYLKQHQLYLSTSYFWDGSQCIHYFICLLSSEGCDPGMYLATNDCCLPYPANSNSTQSGASVCPCFEGYYRAAEDPPEMECTRKCYVPH